LIVYERLGEYYWMGVVMGFIEGELFYKKRRNLIGYKMLGSILLDENRDMIY
jgi:hypothetical protein